MGTYRQLYYQIIFATKHRKPSIHPTHDAELYKYIWGIIQNKKCQLYRINGIEDHLHIMSDLHPSISLARYVQDIKVASSLWMKQSGLFPAFEGWQDGYAAFTYSAGDKDSVINYIKNQKQHHKKESGYEEIKRLLLEHKISFDEKYLL